MQAISFSSQFQAKPSKTRQLQRGLLGLMIGLLPMLGLAQESLIEIKAEQGCTFTYRAGAAIQSVKLLSMASATQCQRGRVEGATAFGLSLTMIQPNNAATVTNEIALMGLMREGVWDGVIASVGARTKNLTLAWQEGRVPMRMVIQANAANRLDSLYQSLDEALSSAAPTNAAANRDYIRTLGEIWARDPDSLLRDLLVDRGRAAIPVNGRSSSNAVNTVPAIADDPKVRGRSARGG